MRHGLIPNLLDSGIKYYYKLLTLTLRPRYNARDATWWYLGALMGSCISEFFFLSQDYCELAPEGTKILEESIDLLFPLGHSNPYGNTNLCE